MIADWKSGCGLPLLFHVSSWRTVGFCICTDLFSVDSDSLPQCKAICNEIQYFVSNCKYYPECNRNTLFHIKMELGRYFIAICSLLEWNHSLVSVAASTCTGDLTLASIPVVSDATVHSCLLSYEVETTVVFCVSRGNFSKGNLLMSSRLPDCALRLQMRTKSLYFKLWHRVWKNTTQRKSIWSDLKVSKERRKKCIVLH